MRRLTYVLGALVVVVAVTAIAVVLGNDPAGPPERTVSYATIKGAMATAPATADPAPSAPEPATPRARNLCPAAVPGASGADASSDAAVPAATIADAAMTPGASSAAAHVAGAAAETASAQAVAAECQRAQLDHSWRELAQCADRLKPLDPRPAAELAMRATKELDSAPHVTAAHAALRDGALKRAKAEIDQVWPGSVDCAHLKHAYDAAEAHRIDALAAQLDRVKDASCEAYPPAPRQVSRLGPAAVWFCCDLPQLPQSTWLSTNGSMSQIRVALLPHVLPLTGGGQSQRDDCAL